ncbi:hypothetical protein [Candidatus Venteria ishoeyi]|nr:hypothetical protein [Candidatus Venteria ishoeyi]
MEKLLRHKEILFKELIMQPVRLVVEDAPTTLVVPEEMRHRRLEVIFWPLVNSNEVLPQTSEIPKQNPIAALLESELIGCAEADPKLSQNYKSELSKSLCKKYDYR